MLVCVVVVCKCVVLCCVVICVVVCWLVWLGGVQCCAVLVVGASVPCGVVWVVVWTCVVVFGVARY